MASESPVEKAHDIEKDSITSLPLAAPESGEHLTRALSSRQVSMIAIGGSIGTGLFLGTGRALATGGPGSLLLNYSLVGAVVFLVMLCLGEMATEFPLAGSFSTYSARFVDEPFGFSIGWNYAFNDAISTAGDLTAAQLLMEYWIPSGHLVWLPSLFFLAFIVVINLIHVKAYGELEYWLSSLKVISIIIFFFLGIAVNAGGNTSHEYIGAKYWTLDDAPFVGGFGGFASLFVTASFAYGGTESIGITAGERNPTRNVPRVINRVFFRILIFYILTVILIGFDIPYNFPNLSTKSTATSPFTLVFAQAGSKAGGSFMNAVILTSVISAGNHALFAGARVVYGLSAIGQAPRVFLHTNRNGVPWVAVLLVASVSLIFFGASFLPGGAGQIWDWVQNLVGIAWWCIGVSSWRFRRAWVAQGRKIMQGWGAWKGGFDKIAFVSNYIELPLFFLLYVVWRLVKRTRTPSLLDIDIDAGRHVEGPEDMANNEDIDRREHRKWGWAWKIYGLVA
ncbi:amino acid permease-domain-containing protein [Mycena metata]|uniref:Amino acid permease-domain-containing protein n=1 Tax=Mycena metata TaxID=1033252 RepID=A0AAD7HDR4_9AGAR|nr:amino acid permease-domain-containing protein [Mycena metata]